MLKSKFDKTVKNINFNKLLLKIKVTYTLAYLSTTVMLFSCLFFYETNNLLLFIFKGVIFNFYISVFFMIKVTLMFTKIFILCLLKSIRATLDDVLLDINVFSMNANKDIFRETS